VQIIVKLFSKVEGRQFGAFINFIHKLAEEVNQ
jgi:hypothetical protein